jgi:cytochrome c oxidase subunit 2
MVARLAGLSAVLVLVSGCSGAWERGGWPAPITEQGRRVLGVWQGFLITAAAVGLFVIGLIIISSIFHRRRGDELPRQVRYNLPIEVLYTIVPVILVAVLFYFTAIRENDEDKLGGTPGLYVGVVGFQWSWQFNYVDNGLSVTGSPGHLPTLVLPVNTTVQFQETSPDVIHAFWVVPFLFKRDVLPGHPNTFQVRLDTIGTFAGKCTEFCGVDHDKMLFTLKVVSQSDYQAWLAQSKGAAANGSNPMFTAYKGPTHNTWNNVDAVQGGGT